MAICYVDDFPGRRLNEVIMAGSHDAGITSGSGNTKTQKLDIGGQAAAGVRLFDIRIAPNKSAAPAPNKASSKLATYHGPGVAMFGKRRFLGGGFGVSLDNIVEDARAFFLTSNDFLILKFDHSDKYAEIADYFRSNIDTHLYRGNKKNINRVKLSELKKKLIVVFEDKAYKKLSTAQRDGILGIKNLKGGGGYDSDYHGLQYFGKGGTSATSNTGVENFNKKLDENIDKQVGLMKSGKNSDPAVMGMMYWTTTGVNDSIMDRDSFNWNKENRKRLFEFLDERLPIHADVTKTSSAPIVKQFMPNFVMMDFADANRCEPVYALNWTIPDVIRKGLAKHNAPNPAPGVQQLAGRVGNLAGQIGQSALKKTGLRNNR